ncbi:MAG: hypothetical protein H5U08_03280 [Thermogutta sp.]|uniref:hypothetical protein n=1 Tax=Thermogutta sp. TaxID=1962930 RepID=UPI00199DCC20|nr:hypothetical protein [Thermogutta sp.]MBC7351357.1 hypothetical protein [Thermogutta sp.]
MAARKAGGPLTQTNGAGEVEPVAWVGVSEGEPSVSQAPHAEKQLREGAPAGGTAEAWRAVKP